MTNDEKGALRSETVTAGRSSFAAHNPAWGARWAVFIALALVALAIRLPQLGVRPMHTDESINGYIIGGILAGDGYHYDPRDRHGPVLYAVAAPIAWLCGARNLAGLTETELRLTPVIFGSVTILLLGCGVEMFGFIPCLVAALLFAVAPLPVYYNRYFIHETLFVDATLGLILAGWSAWRNGKLENCPPSPKSPPPRRGLSRSQLPDDSSVPVSGDHWNQAPCQDTLWRNRSVWFALLAGLCAALMLASKETAVIHFFAFGVAVLCGMWLPPSEPFFPSKLLMAVMGAFVFFGILLFTWFGHNWLVFADLWHAVGNFAARAGGEGHEKAFSYYFHLLDPTFILFLLAIAGVYSAIYDAVNGIRKSPVLMVIYGLTILLVYSAIPYKTPWLALNLWLPLALVCGFGVAAIWEHQQSSGSRNFAGVAGVVLLAVLGIQTKDLAFDHSFDEKNPFAYAHTGDDILGLPLRLEELAKLNHLAQPRIAVVAADAWPLPWYLRKFSTVGYWQPGQETGPADFFITSTDLTSQLKDRLKDYRAEYFGVRPGVLILLWIPPGMKTAG